MFAFSTRPALPGDAPIAGRLIYLSMGPMADFLFSGRTSPSAEHTLASLFAKPQNRFSYQFADVAETGGLIVGLLIAYPSHLMRRLAFAMSRQIAEICGIKAILRLLPLALPFLWVHETEGREYYISNLAVAPDFQGKGIGTFLLKRALSRAVEMGLGRCALSVEVDNARALRLYERLGFRIVKTFEHPWLKRFCGYRGVHRMVADLRGPAYGAAT